MRNFLGSVLIAGIALLVSVANASAVNIFRPEAVIELFTSQGCHSCPAADKLMGKLDGEGKHLTLSWHVDYWDYLGWKDSFASQENTQRQYGYARALHERQVYTPQAVINGRVHSVGSDERRIKTLVSTLGASRQNMTVPISVEKNADEVSIKVNEGDMTGAATLYMVFFNKRHDVEIARGENAGKTIAYHNVVHKTQPLGLVKPEGFDMSYPVNELVKSGYDGCALILQSSDKNGNPSAILGAVVITDM